MCKIMFLCSPSVSESFDTGRSTKAKTISSRQGDGATSTATNRTANKVY